MSVRPKVRWFYCKGASWRVVRRADQDARGREAWAVYRNGNVRPIFAHIEAGEVGTLTLRERMEKAVRTVAKDTPVEAPVAT
jgi:hypothetical protein